jgi:hypothetical protein
MSISVAATDDSWQLKAMPWRPPLIMATGLLGEHVLMTKFISWSHLLKI